MRRKLALLIATAGTLSFVPLRAQADVGARVSRLEERGRPRRVRNDSVTLG